MFALRMKSLAKPTCTLILQVHLSIHVHVTHRALSESSHALHMYSSSNLCYLLLL